MSVTTVAQTVPQTILAIVEKQGPSNVESLASAFTDLRGYIPNINTLRLQTHQLFTAGKLVRVARGMYGLPGRDESAAAQAALAFDFGRWVADQVKSAYPGMLDAKVLRKRFRDQHGPSFPLARFESALKQLVADGLADDESKGRVIWKPVDSPSIFS